jgi:Fur family ferric uptake transcriptional regulator
VSAPEIHDAVEERLRRADQRYTAGRRRLVDVLATTSGPATLPQLMAIDRSIPQSSAYRNLALLEQVGVVTRIVTTGGFASYELAEDLTGHHHHHLVCTGCGDVADFTLAPNVERQLDRVLAAAAEAARYEVEGHRLDLVGRCPSCR